LGNNLLQSAAAGKEVMAINMVAREEGMDPNLLLRKVASGRVVIMQRDGKPSVGIGEGLRTKINANIGTCSEILDIDYEVEKAKVAEKFGADTITDLSMGGPIDEIRGRILEETIEHMILLIVYYRILIVKISAFFQTKL